MMLYHNSSLVINSLSRPNLDTQAALAFFYCSRTSGENERQEPKEILRSIVRQLSSQIPGLPLRPSVIAKYEQKKLAASPPATLSLKESKDLIRKLVQDDYSSVTIVIDALDECNSKTRSEFFWFLEELSKFSGTVLKILVFQSK